MHGKEISPNLKLSTFFSGTAAVIATASDLAGRDLTQTTTSAKPELPTNSLQRYGMAVARVLIAMIFMMTALNIISQALAEHTMVAHGVPAGLVPMLIMAARALQLIAGLGLILGIYPRISALALLLFLIPATLMGHAFWAAIGTPLYTVQLINFFKNVCIAGGLIFIIATPSQPVLLPRRSFRVKNQDRTLETPGKTLLMNIAGLVGALLPVFFVLALGYVAGKRNSFDADQAAGLSKLAVTFALPATLFISMTDIRRDLLLQQGRHGTGDPLVKPPLI